jgi:four helix bundle protein
VVSGEEGQFRLDDFELYRHAREFRKKVYRLIRQLPAEEEYCLDRQMRRAALSITNNIAEGHGRWHFKENIQFCRIARGSIGEILDDLNTCADERYGDAILVEELKVEGYTLIRRVNGYIKELGREARLGESGRWPYYSLLTTHHSPLTTHHSPLTTHH